MNKSKGFQYLETLTPWAGRGDFDLVGIKKVLAHLGNPQDKVPSIHVAGTNGKGSVCALISAGLGQAGFRVGLNISPHLSKLNERFVIDGYPVEDEWIDTFAVKIQEASQKAGVLLSFHEALTAIAFLGFSQSNLDYMVIEVGLGGLLDASNVITKPKACVITSIGLDHQEVLGSSLTEIAKQKAGIIKSGVDVFIGPMEAEALKAIKSVSELAKANLHIITQEYSGSLQLKGAHQRYNAQIAKEVLTSFGLSEITIQQGLNNAFWPGRLENATIKDANDRELLIDCAHNPHGMQALTKFLSQNSIANLHLIFGTLENKDWKQNIDLLLPYIESMGYLIPDSTKGLSGSTIYEYLGNKVKFTQLDWEKDNILNYINKLSSNNLILLTGSIYTVGKLRSLLDIKDKPLWIKNC
jgi:dihydrofolate synthase/folylpolyglutamate synthase